MAFEVGEMVICHDTSNYDFTRGKQYEILSWADAVQVGNFTFPPYVEAIDDKGIRQLCHAARFHRIARHADFTHPTHTPYPQEL